MNKAFNKLLRFSFSLIFLFIFLFSGCGSKQSPTGGKADTNKLKLLAVIPEEFASIDQQQIELTFDKAVDKTSFLTGMYFYPPIQNKKINYEANVIGIRILEALLPDTNYNLILTTRIKDTRGNSLDKSQTLIFRHGVLQNNKIAGAVVYEKASDEGLPVQINLVTLDSLWVLTRQVTGRSYSLEGLNPLTYTLRAYIDKNLNGRYDFGNEPFCEGLIPQQPVSNFDLNMAYADSVLPVIKTVRGISNREYEILLNKPIVSFQNITVENLKTRTGVRLFAVNHEYDKIDLLTEVTDTTKLRFQITDLRDSKGNHNKACSFTISGCPKSDLIAPLVVATNPRNGGSVNSLQPQIEITFSEIITADNFKATLVEAESKKEIPFRIIQSDSRKYILQPEKPLANYKSCLLTIEETTEDLSGNNLKPAYKLAFLPILRR
ncbi:MAG: Ig-like domain-containing protein [Candidatus Cloacimonadaceae bacterium]